MSFGERIAEARQNKKISQSELAAIIGVTRGTVTRWENDSRRPDDETKKELARVLDTSVAYLMGETDEAGEATDIAQKSTGAFRPTRVIPFTPETCIDLPILDPSSIACAGNGNGGMDTLYHEATECITIPKEFLGCVSDQPDEKPFGVRVEGDSMVEAGIPDGCIVAINPIAEVRDRDAALVCYGHDSNWAIKWVYFNEKDGTVEIRSSTLKYPPRRFDSEEIELGLFRIIGKVVQVLGQPKRGQ